MDRKNKNIVKIFVKIIFLLVIISANYFLLKYFNNEFKEAPTVTVIDDADGATTIYISANFNIANILKYLPSIVLGINILILIVFDVLELVNKKFDKKNKLRIILGINLRIIIALIFEIIIYSLIPSMAMLGNIIFISILLIILYHKKIRIEE